MWLDGFEVLPDDPEVVHHVLIHRVSRAAALANDAADGTTDGRFLRAALLGTRLFTVFNTIVRKQSKIIKHGPGGK